MSRRARLTGAGPVLAAVLVLLVACQEPVVEGLDQARATELAVLLEHHGIAAELEADASSARTETPAFAVLVDPEDLPAARAVLVGHQRHTAGVASSALPDDDDASALLGPDRAQRHARAQRRRAAELAASIERVDGIREARVHLDVPADDWMRRGTRDDARASVLLLLEPERSHDAARTERLRNEVTRLVAGAVHGLAPEHLTLVVETAPAPPADLEVPFDAVGPWRVARGSGDGLRLTLGLLLAAIVLQGLGLVGLVLRRRRRQTTAGEHV